MQMKKKAGASIGKGYHGRFKTTHGMSGTRLYNIWDHMKRRCYNENDDRYSRYGGRGITICEKWLDFEPFMKWAKETGYTDELSIDRIDNNHGYYPQNCRWTTNKEQANNRETSRVLVYAGKRRTVAEWADALGVHPDRIHNRINRGWTVERALTSPLPRSKGERCLF